MNSRMMVARAEAADEAITAVFGEDDRPEDLTLEELITTERLEKLIPTGADARRVMPHTLGPALLQTCRDFVVFADAHKGGKRPVMRIGIDFLGRIFWCHSPCICLYRHMATECPERN